MRGGKYFPPVAEVTSLATEQSQSFNEGGEIFPPGGLPFFAVLDLGFCLALRVVVRVPALPGCRSACLGPGCFVLLGGEGSLGFGR